MNPVVIEATTATRMESAAVACMDFVDAAAVFMRIEPIPITPAIELESTFCGDDRS